MSTRRLTASISLDLDDKWSYMKTRGDIRWESFPSYLNLVIPRVLEFLRKRDLTITFFVVGQDAVMPENRAALRSIAEAGHEIANHSFRHEPWLHLYSPEQLRAELRQAEDAIAAATGAKTVGFRGPGYSYSADLLCALTELGYEYDASTLPTFIGPLARFYYFMASGLSRRERGQRDLLFGSWRNGILPLDPYIWRGEAADLVEIPVTTMPVFRAPIHPSYVLYVSRFSETLAFAYFDAALRLCALTQTAPSLLLHPLDFLGCDDGLPELSFFPAMDLPSATKLRSMDRMLTSLCMRFEPVTMRRHARAARRSGTLAVTELVRA